MYSRLLAQVSAPYSFAEWGRDLGDNQRTGIIARSEWDEVGEVGLRSDTG